MKANVLLVGIILLCIYSIMLLHLSMKFNYNCRDPLYIVACTTDLEEAKETLRQVTNYLKQEKFLSDPKCYPTERIFLRLPKNWKRPTKSIARWHLDLFFLHQRLTAVNTVDGIRKQKMLADIRKILLNDQQDEVKIPRGIILFPYNTPLNLLLLIGIGLFSIGGCGMIGEKVNSKKN
ncbi:MAG: hypothetical protein LBI53_06235 [Candidatus Peribacteria bacterium]|nr:hypothetical protein [Candidatus Peribacteria bacterium]